MDVAAYWSEFCAATGTDPATRHDVWAFGDGPEMADRLLAMVLTGPKRATAGLLAEYEHHGDPLPVAGTLSVVLDGSGAPRCVLRSTDVQVKPVREVDEAFAWDEGEGDRTLASWRHDHDEYFRRTLAARGAVYDDTMACVLERFELAWPTAPDARTAPSSQGAG